MMLTEPRYELGDKVKIKHRGATMLGVVRGRTFSRETQYDVLVKGDVFVNVKHEDLEAVQ